MLLLLSLDRFEICRDLMVNGSHTNCTVAVSNVTSYMSTFDELEISDEIDNPSGVFNLTQLRQQAELLPYETTRLLMDSDIMMLYGNVLPGRAIPNLSFLNDTTVNSIEPSPACHLEEMMVMEMMVMVMELLLFHFHNFTMLASCLAFCQCFVN